MLDRPEPSRHATLATRRSHPRGDARAAGRDARTHPAHVRDASLRTDISNQAVSHAVGRAPAGTRRDCGDFTEACASGYTYPRVDSAPRATADQFAAPSDETVYVVFEQTIPGTQTPTGTTFGTIEPGTGGQGGVYFMRLNGATGACGDDGLELKHRLADFEVGRLDLARGNDNGAV